MPSFRRFATRFAVAIKISSLLALTSVGGLVSLSGCAYHMGTGDRQVPGGYRTVAVPVFKNASHEAGIEVYFTNAFIREMQRARIGTIADRASSQVTLEGTIDQVTYAGGGAITGTGFSGNGYPDGSVLNTSTSIGVVTTLRLRRNSDQKILWEGSFSRAKAYYSPKVGYEDLTAMNALYDHSARYQNIEMLAQDMMSEAHDRLTENF